MKSSRLTTFNVLICVCLILWTAFIWRNSIPTKEASTAQSQQVIELVEPILEALRIPPESYQHVVRKTAHFVEFFVLGTLWTTLFRGRNCRWPLLFCLLTAMADEGLQALTGRGNQWSDVALDFCGSAVAVAAVSLLFLGFYHLKQTKQ